MNQVKAVIMGEGGVGKTTLVSLLKGKQIPRQRKPTIGVDVEKVCLDKNQICVWDLAGQNRFKFMWNDFLKGSELTVVVTDSSQRNVKETKKILQQYDRKLGSKIIAIANKQDLVGSMTPEDISKELGVPTYGMVAINEDNQDALRKIITSRMASI